MIPRTHFRSPESEPPSTAVHPPIVSPAIQVNALTAQLIATHGTVENALRHLVLQSAATDQTIQAHERTIADLREKQPKAGDVVIPKAEALEYAKVVALNLKPDEIVAKVKQADVLQQKDATRSLADLAKDAATASQIDPDAFAALATAKGLHLEAKDVPVVEKGKTVTKKLWHVRPASDEKAALVPVSDYTKSLPAYEQRALQVTASAPVVAGTPWPTGQVPTSGSPVGSNATSDYLNKRFAPRQPAGAVAS